ncbi:MAG: nitrate/nitrite transporter NrtS [Pseudomonadota bacterium]
MIDATRLRKIARLLCMRDITRSSLRIALLVGTVLNLINQSGAWLHGDDLQVGHLMLNYFVPYCVASYSAVRTRLQDMEAVTGRAGRPDGPEV